MGICESFSLLSDRFGSLCLFFLSFVHNPFYILLFCWPIEEDQIYPILPCLDVLNSPSVGVRGNQLRSVVVMVAQLVTTHSACSPHAVRLRSSVEPPLSARWHTDTPLSPHTRHSLINCSLELTEIWEMETIYLDTVSRHHHPVRRLEEHLRFQEGELPMLTTDLLGTLPSWPSSDAETTKISWEIWSCVTRNVMPSPFKAVIQTVKC